jgi:hypothetical protein
VSQGRRPADLLEIDTGQDVDDPMGGPYRGFLAMVAEVYALIGELGWLIWSTPSGRGAEVEGPNHA